MTTTVPVEQALAQAREIKALRAEVGGLQRWVNDLQAGMYINCVYCGRRYGPSDEMPATMAQMLKDHIEQCLKHPMSVMKAEVATLTGQLREQSRVCVEAFNVLQTSAIMKANVKALAEALTPFGSGGDWGTRKAYMVHGSETKEQGIAASREITGWQVAVDAALARPGVVAGREERTG